MTSMINTVSKSSRVVRGSPALNQVLKKGISTRELDATKGGK